MKSFVHAIAALGLAVATPALAQGIPLARGDYVEVTGISIDDGHMIDYAQFLAGYFKAQEDYAKAQGWQLGTEILANVNKRKGEPDLYVVRRYKTLPDGAERDRRAELVRQHVKMSDAQLQAASGDRAKFRHIDSSQMLQVLTIK